MKRLATIALVTAAAVTLVSSCAKSVATGKNDLNKQYFDAWIKTHFPDAQKSTLGVYVLEDIPGTGEMIGDTVSSPYVYASYTVKDLEGNISSTTFSEVSKMVGDYDPTNYYGDYVISRADGGYAGINEMLSTMRIGGTRTAAIPGWLMTTDQYDTEEDYLKNSSGTEAIYTLSVSDKFEDVIEWELDSLDTYVKRHYPGIDTVAKGFYYIQLKAPIDTTNFDSEATVYIDYIGRLLNGQAFDTTIEDTAKVEGLYSADKDYAPVYLTWNTENYTSITMGESSSSLVEGFTKTVSRMRTGEIGLGIFHSAYGYSTSGSGSTIPPYSPLIFEIRVLGLNEDGSIDEDDD